MRKYWHRLLLLVAGPMLVGAFASAHAYDCSKKYCTRMQSCGEAYYKFTVCHHHGLDRDNDGIPCEVVCGDDLETFQSRLRQEGLTPAVEGAPAVQDAPAPIEPQSLMQGETVVHPDAALPDAAAPLTCAGKTRCGQMRSCAEARFYLMRCGVTSLDRDRDGIPCESLCRPD